MAKVIKLLTGFGFLTAATLLATLPANAQERKTLGSGPDVYRVEIRNMDRFKVLETGDNDGVGELHEMSVRLASYHPDSRDQYDAFRQRSPLLYNSRTGKSGGFGNLEIKVGDHVRLGGHRPPRDATELWIHAYSNPDDPEYNRTGNNNGLVTLEVSATELDCAGQRVCRRNCKGTTTISFRIPDFAERPSNRCGPANTFRLEPLDDEVQISGLSNARVRSRANRRPVNDPFFLLLRHKKGGPRLMPFNLDICIASTVKPAPR